MLALGATFRLLSGERKRAPLADFDTQGALLATGGMLLLVYALIKAPDVGWGNARTIAMLVAAGVILAAFLLNERRSRNPLISLSIFRVKGLLDAGSAGPLLLNGVQHVVHPPVHLDAWPDDDRRSRLVFIGLGLERDELECSLAAFNDAALRG